ncbi:DUF2798 domain-containing protein [Papillibacter cinnamivorans]|uniref:DUF2798 domain-containing protein n=1 Tax=Papillibacter cinnamivorans DSM 12816 TaxID=1122930 RepID=A0A1W2BHT3_9FIRM|nr:DUF2798 domain-containing protein [Papillibacter cinnamivorans]SMC72446.1 hypothetical protein SAMN02745168_2208 [Papillibacter cinnamivorans DSM 12816]
MPKTKAQKILFSVLMSFVMVYGMEVYNSAILHRGLTNALFLLPMGEVLILMAVVMGLETFIGGPLARRLAFGLIDPSKDRPIAVILAIQIMTVCIMCPIMSLVATIAFKGGLDPQAAAIWVQTVAINFPMALCWQLFIAGPLVRRIVGYSLSPHTNKKML